VAVRIDRVEREFILVTAAGAKTEARLRAAGRSLSCRIASADGERVGLTVSGDVPHFAHREVVSVCFDFRGQAVAFESPLLASKAGTIEIGLPEAPYRSLARRWPRVRSPKDLSVEFILPDTRLKLDCPESEEWTDVELPQLSAGLDSSSLVSLVDSFRSKASTIASEGRIIMYKNRGPETIAEEMPARLGRVLFVPSSLANLPLTDPYPSGRIITSEMAKDYEGVSTVAQGSRLSAFLRERAVEGMCSGLWSPVLYYHYTVGIVHMNNGPERRRALDFEAVDLAWEFSRVLAWFLRRHGYFANSAGEPSFLKGNVIDASPAGILAALPPGSPKVDSNSVIKIRLGLKGKKIVCSGKVARRYDERGHGFCGIAFMDLSAQDTAALSLGLYGEEGHPAGQGA
jgi:hypothetical protein